MSTIAITSPHQAAEQGVDQPLEDERAGDPAAPRAERHLHADLARLLLDHRVHDVGHADAADQQGQAADDAEEDLDAHEDLVHHLAPSTVSQISDHLLVGRVEAVARHRAPRPNCSSASGMSSASGDLEHDVAQPLAAELGAKVVIGMTAWSSSGRRSRPSGSSPACTPITGYGDRVDQQGLADRILVAEESAGELVAEEDDPALLGLVDGLRKRPPAPGEVVADLAVLPARADHPSVDRAAPAAQTRRCES